jgi:hypothetical protein
MTIDVDVTTTNTLIQITVNRIHDRGNIRRYVFLKKAFIGFDIEGEGTNHAYIVLYMHDRNIRFELPKDSGKRENTVSLLTDIISGL